MMQINGFLVHSCKKLEKQQSEKLIDRIYFHN